MKGIQPSLSAGELSPGLHGRVDIARYQISLATCRNFITKASGGVTKRPGTMFLDEVKDSAAATRLIPFIYSTEVAYLIEAGDEYFRFYAGDALLLEASKAITGASQANPCSITATAHGYSTGDTVWIEGVGGMTNLNGRYFVITVTGANTFTLDGENSTTYPAYTSGGTAEKVVEVATPYATADLPLVRHTQSADVLYLVHPDFPPQELRRLTSTSFELAEYDNRLGPLRALNTNKGVKMAASAALGSVTITVSEAMFTADMVGAYVYLEEEELQTVKPWEPAAKNIAVGDYRRSDGKVYVCTAVSTGGTYHVCGVTRPTHDYGRAWDGSGDTRSDGVNNYTVGVEWEFYHAGYGLAKITTYNSTTSVAATVVSRIPDSCVGTASVVATYNHTGDGVTTVFAITGAVATSTVDYTVTIAGQGIPANN